MEKNIVTQEIGPTFDKILDLNEEEGNTLTDFFDQLSIKRDVRHASTKDALTPENGTASKLGTNPDNPKRAQWLLYLKTILNSFKYFDPKNPKTPRLPYNDLLYSDLVLVFAQEVFKHLWFSITSLLCGSNT